MPKNGNHLPKPEAVWIALGIVVFAIALSAPPKQRRTFINALAALTAEHESTERVIAFGRRGRWNGMMSAAIRGGTSWLKRLIVELERVAGA